jgi:hypothetical protein
MSNDIIGYETILEEYVNLRDAQSVSTLPVMGSGSWTASTYL